MLGMFKNPYKNSDPYPTVTKAQEAEWYILFLPR